MNRACILLYSILFKIYNILYNFEQYEKTKLFERLFIKHAKINILRFYSTSQITIIKRKIFIIKIYVYSETLIGP